MRAITKQTGRVYGLTERYRNPPPRGCAVCSQARWVRARALAAFVQQRADDAVHIMPRSPLLRWRRQAAHMEPHAMRRHAREICRC